MIRRTNSLQPTAAGHFGFSHFLSFVGHWFSGGSGWIKSLRRGGDLRWNHTLVPEPMRSELKWSGPP